MKHASFVRHRIIGIRFFTITVLGWQLHLYDPRQFPAHLPWYLYLRRAPLIKRKPWFER